MPKAAKEPKTVDTQRQGPWFIVNMTSRFSKKSILRGQKPTRIFHSLPEALVNAHKLTEVYPNNHWAIFECIGSSCMMDPNRKIKPKPNVERVAEVL